MVEVVLGQKLGQVYWMARVEVRKFKGGRERES